MLMVVKSGFMDVCCFSNTSMDYSKIKIIIWDLDDTFWKGTLSEGGVEAVVENIELVKNATRHGVVNSICSKNTKDVTMQRLEEMGVAGYFVFPSIDWTPKGERISRLLKIMGLRPANALFLDDNIQNLNEAKHYSETLMVAEPSIIPELIAYFESTPESDPKLKRLDQYKVLEKKEEAKEEYSSNDDFLYSCNLRVEMHEDCMEQIDRITELVHRSNQLNYTKLRSTKEELTELISQANIKSGWVTVKDNFGDYGMVGFYAIDTIKNECIHLLFSCRTIGQGVEQYVYAKLGYPKLSVVGEVIAMVNKDPIPAWINQENVAAAEQASHTGEKLSILFKGPCDLQTLTKYIQGSCNIDEEFTYVGGKGNVINGHNHSVSLCGLLDYSDAEKEELIKDCIFFDKDYYISNLFKKEYDIIFFSSVLESNLGIYRKRGTNLEIVFGEAKHPISDPRMHDGIEKGIYDNGQNTFTKQIFEEFNSKYEFVGQSTPETYIQRMEYVLEHLPNKTKICFVLGSELKHEAETRDHMVGREELHIEFNNALRSFAEKHSGRVFLLEVNKIIKNQSDYDGSINHFTLKIYYELAQEVIRMLNEISGQNVLVSKSKISVLILNLKAWFKSFVKDLLPKDSGLYKAIRGWYRKL